jgi:hypothetical protein
VLKILKIRPKLTVLNMQLPYVKELTINGEGTYLLFNLGIGDRGVQFIAQNLISLTTLHICKQSDDLGLNCVGD